MSETPTPQTELEPKRQAGVGVTDFIHKLRSQNEICSNEIQRRRVVVEDEWQTTEDCLNDGLFADASFYLSRMISEAKRLLRIIENTENHLSREDGKASTESDKQK